MSKFAVGVVDSPHSCLEWIVGLIVYSVLFMSQIQEPLLSALSDKSDTLW